jgi:site-specific recombinase XerD
MDFEEVVEAYLAGLDGTEASKALRRGQLCRFQAFVGRFWTVSGPVCTADIVPSQGVPFARWLREEKGLAISTVDNYLASLAQFLRWLLAEGRANFGQQELEAFLEERGTLEHRQESWLPRVPAEEEVVSLIEAARAVPVTTDERANLRRLRNIALLETLRSTGVRPRELVAMRYGDLDLERQTARVGSRRVYFDLAAWGALTHYLQARGIEPLPLLSWHKPLFARHRNVRGEEDVPVSLRLVEWVVQKLRPNAEGITPRLLRSRFGVRLAGAADLKRCAQALDVSHSTALRYERLADEAET